MDRLLSLNKKKQVLKKQGIKYNAEELKEEYENDELVQIHTKPRYNKKKAMQIYAPPQSYQIDVIFMPKFKYANGNYDKILILIEITSRKAYAFPLKTNKMDEIIERMEELKSKIKIGAISGDREFAAGSFKDWCDKYNINLYYDTAADDHISKGDKLGIVDRFTRTIKMYLLKNMIANDNSNWIKDLQEIIDFYNSTPHDSLKGQSPNEVAKDDWKMGEIYMSRFLHNNESKQEFKFKVGDTVRIILAKGLHDKEGQTFSNSLYTISDIVRNKYKVADADGVTLKRGFKPHELLKVNEEKLKPISKPLEIPKVIKTQKNVRLLRREGITNEEESKKLVDDVEEERSQPMEPTIRQSGRIRKAPEFLRF